MAGSWSRKRTTRGPGAPSGVAHRYSWPRAVRRFSKGCGSTAERSRPQRTIALDLGVPVSGIAEAVFSRALSGNRGLRNATRGLPGPKESHLDPAARAALVDDVEQALYASKIVAYAQGFNQIQAGSDESAELRREAFELVNRPARQQRGACP